MEGFAQFTPIENRIKEEALQYYAENNLDVPTNAFFVDYLEKPTKTKTVTKDKKIHISKKQPIKKQPIIKRSEPVKISKTPLPTIDLSSKKEWPYKDNTVSNLVDISEADKHKQNFLTELNKLDYSNEDKEYATKLVGRESSYIPNVKNQLGYYGLFQFGRSAMDWLGLNKKDLSKISDQIHAGMKLTYLNDSILGDIRNKYEGKEYKGVKITKNGIRAAAHLLGAATVKDWFNGTKLTKLAKKGFKDANGTHITEYLKMFEE